MIWIKPAAVAGSPTAPGATRIGLPLYNCGQAPSDHIEVARYLVELGIDSISLTPDRVLQTMQAVQKIEAALGRKGRA